MKSPRSEHGWTQGESRPLGLESGVGRPAPPGSESEERGAACHLQGPQGLGP